MSSRKLELRSKIFRPAEVETVTGWSTGAQRDLQRRGYTFGDDAGGKWLSATAHDLAKLLLAKTLRDAGLELSEAWQRSHDEIVGYIVLHAILDYDAVDMFPDGRDVTPQYLKQKLKLAMDFASSGENHVGGGDYFVFGPTIPAGQYMSLLSALEEAERSGPGPHLVFHAVSLKELSKLLARRAGELAYVEEVVSRARA